MITEGQARVVPCVREDRHHPVGRVRERGRQRVQHRVEVDQVRPWTARGVEVQEDVPIGIEAAPVPDVAVVVVDTDGVVELRPTDAFQVDGEGLALFHDKRGNALPDDALLHVERGLCHQVSVLDELHDVPAPKAGGDGDRGVQRPVRGCWVTQWRRRKYPACTGTVDTVTDDRGPDELDGGGRQA